jgi:hypothetical protein
MRVFVSRLSRAVSGYAPSARNVYGLPLNIAIRNSQFAILHRVAIYKVMI